MIIFGASGHGKVIYDIILKRNDFEVDCFVDDNPKGEIFCGVPLFHSSEVDLANKDIIIAIGNNSIREKLSNSLSMSNFITAIHPSSVLSNSTKIGKGTVIMANSSINFDAKIGEHCILNTNCVIEHDCKIGDYVHISPNASLSGNVTVGKGTHIGIGASVIQGISIGSNVIIGAGAVIIRDVPDNTTVVGNPGRIIKTQTKKI